MWIGKHETGSFHDKSEVLCGVEHIFWSAMWIGDDVTGWFHEQFEVISVLEHMIQDEVLT
jgi:hypothetical protein